MSYQDDVNARYIQDQDGLDFEMLMDVMIGRSPHMQAFDDNS